MTVEQYLDAWVSTYVQPFKRPSTTECYQRAMRQLPEDVRRMEMATIDPMRVQRAINEQAVATPRAAQLTYAMLHAAMARAVKLRMIPYNVLDMCDKPRHEAKRAAVLDVEQLRRYLAAAKNTAAYPLLLMMASCGLRRSEALGLKWADLDVERNQLRIERQRVRVRGQGMQPAPLKSRSSARVLGLSGEITEMLLEWRVCAPVIAFDGWICDCTPERLTKCHQKAILDAGLPYVTPHGLRHSIATALAAEGTPMKGLQAILGHSHYQLTADLYADHIAAIQYAPDMARMMARML